jgi:hypothetical protein
MKHWVLHILLVFLPIQVWAENASNVRVRQRNKDIVVTYDLSKTSNVQLFVATKAHPAYTKLKALSGAVGKHVCAGKNLEIVWHPLEESESFIAEGVRFKVEALGAYEEYALRKDDGGASNMETYITADFAYSLSPQMSYGCTLGQTYRGYGWYINARSNFNFESATDGLACSEGGYIGGTLPFYSGLTQNSAFVCNVGFVMDILEAVSASKRNRFNTLGYYIGGGYGWRRLLWETIDHRWVEYTPTSQKGFCANFGIIGSVYGLALKAGVNTINFKYLELEVGIGWMF